MSHLIQRGQTAFAPAPRHPLRARLKLVRPRVRASNADDQDLKLFVMSFTAFFICFYSMIA
ncbi:MULTISPECIES: hypothetical protein [unclassified Sphingomonas]|jgi:hypothetical protein|uniref:hypothetical protein n=1 Tax=unclassified Sphingomonas TaxID=196159 RepID=UPI00082E576F|nr:MULTISPECIES: hypothetical protein [unclassified Sphingomonas]MCH4893890.1 hypothetical protein [Sphingomonas sp. SFZ2018-12]